MAQEIKVADKAGNIATVNADDVSTRALIAAGILTVVTEAKVEPTKVTVWKKVLQESGAVLTIKCGTCKSTTNFDGSPELLPQLGNMLCIHVDKAEFAAAAEQYKTTYNGKGNSLGADYFKTYHSQRNPDPPKVGLPDPSGNFFNQQTERVSN